MSVDLVLFLLLFCRVKFHRKWRCLIVGWARLWAVIRSWSA